MVNNQHKRLTLKKITTMKAKNILMSILLAVGSIAAKAATGYPPELALVSQPVMVYNYNSITVYYDVENIGDYTYRGNVYLYLDPDYGYYYADKYVRVNPGCIKRIAINIPSRRIDRGMPFTIMPYYEMGDELYSFTTFEYFEPLSFYWSGPRTERWVVVSAPPRIRIYTRPGLYRYYYDGYRPPMPPPPPGGPAYGHGTPPPPMNPMHHTYGYHSNNGGYPATHNVTPPAEPAPNSPAPTATVRPKTNSGSMSSGGNHSTNSGSGASTGSATPSRPSGTSTGSVTPSRPSTGTSSSGRTGSSVSRPNSSSNGPSTRPTTNGSGSSTGSVTPSRPSTGTSSSGHTGSSVSRPSSNNRPSGTSSSGTSRVGGSSSTRNSGTSTGSSSTRSSSSNSASSRNSSGSSSRSSGSSSGRR